MSEVTGAVHSGQGGVDPEVWLRLPLIRRCPGASLQARRPTAVLHRVLGSDAGPSRLLGPHRLAQYGRQSLASPVSSDALATGSRRSGQTGTADAALLEVGRTFVPNRLSGAYLAAAYAQVV